MDSTRLISRSVGRFLSGTLISRVTGFMRDMALAACFGSTPAIAAFLMAFRFANLPRRLFGEGAMHAAFVPAYEKLKAENPERARRFFRDLSFSLTLFLLLLIAVVGLALWFAMPLVSQGTRQVLLLTILMLPSVLFLCLYGLNSAYFNCERRYFRPSAAPAVFNISLVAVVLCKPSITFLSDAVLFAFALQWIVLWQPIKGKFLTKEVRAILRPLGLGILGVAATQINSALDPIFARIATPEGPAYLWYALRLQQLPLALFGVAFSGALLPPLARERERHEELLGYAQKQAITLMLPATLAMIVLALPAINLVYGRGAFNSSVETSHCLIAYALGLLPMTLSLVRAAGYQAQGNYLRPAVISGITVGINICLNTLFVWRFGVVGVALATSVSAWCQLLLLGPAPWVWFMRLGLPSAIGAIAAHLLLPYLGDPLTRQLGTQLLQFGLPALLFLVCALLSKELRGALRALV